MLSRLAPFACRLLGASLLGAVVAGLFSLPSLVGSIDLARAQPGSQSVTSQTFRTFSAAVVFSPATTATADFFTISGPTTANSMVRVTRVSCYGTSTAVAVLPVSIIKRSAVPSVAGTSTSPTAVAHDTQDTPAATAVVRAYTVAPTPGAAVGTIRVMPLFSTVTGTPTQTLPAVAEFSSRRAERQGVILRSAAQILALNTTAVAGQVVGCEVTWTETP